ncbi:MAG: DUF480 domain-containing protein [Planctomycetota bacterium]|nr:DUF480 domain-containing protein [Planctomycetota bacterium]
MQEPPQSDSGSIAPSWRPLSAIERRVAGALVEKAKTTPAGYPMTLNSVRVACNQKSNRFPPMQLDEEDVIQSLDSLRNHGAVIEVHGDGRTAKYRHQLYDWLGVDKPEIAVLTELLLRGAQTVGELRGRAARMEPIVDLAALQPVLSSLEKKKLIVYLTPQGRGCIVTHALYQPQELAALRREHGTAAPSAPQPPPTPTPTVSGTGPPQSTEAADPGAVDALRREVDRLRSDNCELRDQLDRIASELRREVSEIRKQLGIL